MWNDTFFNGTNVPNNFAASLNDNNQFCSISQFFLIIAYQYKTTVFNDHPWEQYKWPLYTSGSYSEVIYIVTISWEAL